MINKRTAYVFAICFAVYIYAAIPSGATQTRMKKKTGGKKIVASPMICDGPTPTPTGSPAE